MTLDTSSWQRILQIKRSKVTGNENVKVVFRSCLRKKWVDLHQTNTKIIPRLILHIIEYISPMKTRNICDICLSLSHSLRFVYSELLRLTVKDRILWEVTP